MDSDAQELLGDDLARLLEEGASSESTQLIASAIGFKLKTIFGAKKRRVQIESELAMLNAALIIYTVNQNYDVLSAKIIIDEFLQKSKMYVFRKLENSSHNFRDNYSERLSEYFDIMPQEKSLLRLSSLLMNHLGIDPIKNLEGQMFVLAHISAIVKEAAAIVGKGNFVFIK